LVKGNKKIKIKNSVIYSPLSCSKHEKPKHQKPKHIFPLFSIINKELFGKVLIRHPYSNMVTFR